jgi:tetratricopeptide (TPR) repeat protein
MNTAGRWGALLAALAIVLLSVLPFVAALHFELVWDDPLLLAQVGHDAEHGGAASLFTSDFRLHANQSMGFYRPVTTLTLWAQIQAAWHAGKEAALGSAASSLHAVNLLLHAACSLLVWRLLRRLTGSGVASWLGAAIFAVHPVHVEPAVFVAARTDTLAALGVLSSFLCWLCARDASGTRMAWLGTGAASAFLAMLAKETALFVPVVLAAWAWLLPARAPRWKEWLPLWTLAAAIALVMRTQLAHVGFGPHQALPGTGSVAWFFKLGIPALLLYLKLWFWPWPLNSDYSAAQVAITWMSMAAFLATAACVEIARRRGRGREALMSLTVVLMFLLPVMHLAPLHGAAAAERFLYLPSVGLAMLLALVLVALEPGRIARMSSRSIAVAAILAGAIVSVYGTRPWASNATLFAHAVQTSPDSPGAHYGYAGILEKQGRHADAIREYSEAIRLRPDYTDAYVLLGIEQTRAGNYAEARAALERARALEPDRPGIYTNLGVVTVKEGRLAESVQYFRRAAELDPQSPRVHYNLALALTRSGDDAGAEREIEILERLDPRAVEKLRQKTRK